MPAKKFQLATCPFCGSTPEIQPWHGGKPTKVMISCPEDGCYVSPQVTGETPREAVTRWNSRQSTWSVEVEYDTDRRSP